MINKKILPVLLIIGAIISIYLTYIHYNPGLLVCPEGSIINCADVAASSYSVILGVPLALYSFLWFVVATILVSTRERA